MIARMGRAQEGVEAGVQEGAQEGAQAGVEAGVEAGGKVKCRASWRITKRKSAGSAFVVLAL